MSFMYLFHNLLITIFYLPKEIYEAPQASSKPAIVFASSQNNHSIGTPLDDLSSQPSPLLPAAHKPRMRWTPELHDCFVEAVNKLDGAESE